MIETIKVKKQLTLVELLAWAKENNIRNRQFVNMRDDEVINIDECGNVRFDNHLYLNSSLFEVEVEEEITEDMEFEFVVINTEDFVYSFRHNSIKECRDKVPKVIEIFARIDGRLQKIWERE